MAFQVSEGEVIEGFLCPICMEDLSSITQLQAHFEEKHASEDKAVLNSLKGLFNKAKRKFLSEDDVEGLSLKLRNPFANQASSTIVNNPWDWEPFLPVQCRSHTIYFKKVRSARIDSYVAETNKLLIRLDKLLSQVPSDPVKRKAVEKDLVPWVKNKDVPLCPFCARSFNLARRRHHCRLCGAIMCDECSKFLPFSFCRKLVSPVHQGSSAGNNPHIHTGDEKSSTGSWSSLLGSFHGIRRSGSHGSLNSLLSVMDTSGKDQSFRICSHCMTRLTIRDRQVEQRTSKPLLSVYYEKLMDYRKQLLTHIPQYSKMAESLSNGETTYYLSDTEELRMRILKLSDSISMTAQKIRNLGISGVALEEQGLQSTVDRSKISPSPRQELLQKRIHSSTVSFLKENVLGLPKLPSADEVMKRQERRRKETEARLAAEREASKMAEERAALILRQRNTGKESPKSVMTNSNNNSRASTPRRRTNEVNTDTGWGADKAAHLVTETDDPIVQQMNIIRNYIRQAREASKYDEVSLLEANLKELQIEFKKRERLLEA